MEEEKLLIPIKFSEEIDLLDFQNMPKLIKLGYKAANDIMPQIKEMFCCN